MRSSLKHEHANTYMMASDTLKTKNIVIKVENETIQMFSRTSITDPDLPLHGQWTTLKYPAYKPLCYPGGTGVLPSIDYTGI